MKHVRKILKRKRNSQKNNPENIKIEYEKRKLLSVGNQFDTKALEPFQKSIKSFKSKEQLEQFNEDAILLKKLYLYYHVAEYAKKIQTGRCSEHAKHAAFKLFEIDKTHNTFTKIQLITIKYDTGDGHEFLLINGNIRDRDITNDPAKVKKLMQGLKQGYVCETWNEGVFIEAAKITNEIYSNGHSITVETLSKEFDVSDLPKPCAEFFKKTLKEIKLEHLIKDKNEKKNRMEL